MFVTVCNNEVHALIFLMSFGGGNPVYSFFYLQKKVVDMICEISSHCPYQLADNVSQINKNIKKVLFWSEITWMSFLQVV